MSKTVLEQDGDCYKSHPFARWLSDRLPILVPEPTAERRFKWWNRWADRQRVRRCAAIFVVFLLAVVLATWTNGAYREHMRHEDSSGLFHRIVTLITAVSISFQVGVVLFWSKFIYTFAGSSTEDRAMLEYGKSYDKLTTTQRRRMLAQYRAEIFTRLFYVDERQAGQHERADQMAYRLLRRTAIGIVIVAWATYHAAKSLLPT